MIERHCFAKVLRRQLLVSFLFLEHQSAVFVHYCFQVSHSSGPAGEDGIVVQFLGVLLDSQQTFVHWTRVGTADFRKLLELLENIESLLLVISFQSSTSKDKGSQQWDVGLKPTHSLPHFQDDSWLEGHCSWKVSFCPH